MSFKEFFATTKGKIITLASGATVVAVGVAVAVMLQGSGYRSIVVEQTEGKVAVVGTKNTGDAYQGEKLYDGDNVSVMADSSLVMCMDSDKYVYADAGTDFGIHASSAKEDSLLKLTLNSGSELNELKSKLGPNDTYEVDTPNSTMSVRGTTFRVTVYKEGAYIYTLLEVESGEVLCKLKTNDGDYNGVEASFTAGQSALIRSDLDVSEFVVGEENKIILILDYDNLPKVAIDRLIELTKHMQDNMIVGDIEAQHVEVRIEDEADSQDESSDDANPDDDSSDTNSGDSLDDNGENIVAEALSGDDGNGTGNGNSKALDDKKHVHTAGDWTVVKEVTCSANGERQKVCTSCGEVVATETIAATNHVAGEWVVYSQPDCIHIGAKSQSCIYCNKTIKNEDIPMTGHNYSGWNCTVCGATDPNKPAETVYVASDPTPAAPAAPGAGGGCSHVWSQSPAGPAVCVLCGATS